MSILADTLRLRREAMRLQQRTLAARLGVRQQTVSLLDACWEEHRNRLLAAAGVPPVTGAGH